MKKNYLDYIKRLSEQKERKIFILTLIISLVTIVALSLAIVFTRKYNYYYFPLIISLFTFFLILTKMKLRLKRIPIDVKILKILWFTLVTIILFALSFSINTRNILFFILNPILGLFTYFIIFQSKKIEKAFWYIFGISLLNNLSIFCLDGYRLHTDWGYYITNMNNIINTHSITSVFGNYKSYPIYLLFISKIKIITGLNDYLTYLISIAVLSLVLVVFYLILKKFFSTKHALMISLILAYMPGYIHFLQWSIPFTFSVLIIMTIVLIYILKIRYKFILIYILFVILILTHFMNSVIFVLISLSYLIIFNKLRKNIVLSFLLILTPLCYGIYITNTFEYYILTNFSLNLSNTLQNISYTTGVTIIKIFNQIPKILLYSIILVGIYIIFFLNKKQIKYALLFLIISLFTYLNLFLNILKIIPSRWDLFISIMGSIITFQFFKNAKKNILILGIFLLFISFSINGSTSSFDSPLGRQYVSREFISINDDISLRSIDAINNGTITYSENIYNSYLSRYINGSYNNGDNKESIYQVIDIEHLNNVNQEIIILQTKPNYKIIQVNDNSSRISIENSKLPFKKERKSRIYDSGEIFCYY